MKIWQLVLSLVFTVALMNIGVAVGTEPFALHEVHWDQICVVESPGIGYSYLMNGASMRSFQCDVGLQQGDVCKIVYSRGVWKKSFIIDTPGEHIRGMDGEIRQGDSLTATITHKGSVVEKEKAIIIIVDGKLDMGHVPHI